LEKKAINSAILFGAGVYWHSQIDGKSDDDDDDDDRYDAGGRLQTKEMIGSEAGRWLRVIFICKRAGDGFNAKTVRVILTRPWPVVPLRIALFSFTTTRPFRAFLSPEHIFSLIHIFLHAPGIPRRRFL